MLMRVYAMLSFTNTRTITGNTTGSRVLVQL